MKIKNLLFTALVLLAVPCSVYAQHTLKDRTIIDNAAALYESGKYSAAYHQFERLKESLAPDSKAYAMSIEYYMAASAVKLGQDNSQQLVDDFIADYPSSIYKTQVYVLSGDLAYSKEDYYGAMSRYALADPFELDAASRSSYYFNKAYSLFKCDQTQEAYRNFSLAKGNPLYASASTYYMAYIDYTDGDYSKALDGFSSLTSDEKFGPVVPFYILHIKYYQADYQYVIDNGTVLINSAQGQRLADIARIVSESYFHKQNYRQAIRYMELYSDTSATALTRQENYMLGYSYYMIGDYTNTVGILTRIVEGDDLLTQNAYYHLADAALKNGDKKTAMMAFSMAAAADYNQTIKEDAMFNYARLQFEQDDNMFSQAITTITAYMEKYPDSPRIDQMRSYLIAAYFNSRNYQAALEAIGKLKTLNNEEKTALQKIAYFRGAEYYMDNDYANAMKYFDMSLANPYNSRYTALTRYWKAETLVKQERYSEAVGYYKDYVATAPQSEKEYALAYYNLGYCYFNLKKWPDAKSSFEKFMSLHSAKDNYAADAANRLGDISFVGKEYWQAINNYEKAASSAGPVGDYAAYQRAVALGLVNKTQGKIDALNQIIAKGTSEYTDKAMFELGRTYILSDRYADGAGILKNLVDRYPQSQYYPGALTELGLVSQNMGRSAEAVKYFKRVIEEYRNTPQARDAMVALKNIYVDNNDINGYYDYAARSGIETNVTVMEKDSLTYIAARRIYLAGNFSEASNAFGTYLKNYPSGAYIIEANFFRADALSSLGRTKEALEGYEKVVDMPYSQYTASALEKTSKQNFADGNYQKAYDQYVRLLSASTQPTVLNAAYSGMLASAKALGGNDILVAASDRIIKDAAAPAPLKQEASAAKGKVLYHKGDLAGALPLLRTGSENVKTAYGAESKYLVAKVLFDQGKTEQAQKEIFAFSEQNPPYPNWMARAFVLLGDTYIKLGDTFQAKATYKSVVDGYADKTDGIAAEAKEKLNNIK